MLNARKCTFKIIQNHSSWLKRHPKPALLLTSSDLHLSLGSTMFHHVPPCSTPSWHQQFSWHVQFWPSHFWRCTVLPVAVSGSFTYNLQGALEFGLPGEVEETWAEHTKLGPWNHYVISTCIYLYNIYIWLYVYIHYNI